MRPKLGSNWRWNQFAIKHTASSCFSAAFAGRSFPAKGIHFCCIFLSAFSEALGSSLRFKITSFLGGTIGLLGGTGGGTPRPNGMDFRTTVETLLDSPLRFFAIGLAASFGCGELAMVADRMVALGAKVRSCQNTQTENISADHKSCYYCKKKNQQLLLQNRNRSIYLHASWRYLRWCCNRIIRFAAVQNRWVWRYRSV